MSVHLLLESVGTVKTTERVAALVYVSRVLFKSETSSRWDMLSNRMKPLEPLICWEPIRQDGSTEPKNRSIGDLKIAAVYERSHTPCDCNPGAVSSPPVVRYRQICYTRSQFCPRPNGPLLCIVVVRSQSAID
jgi:hypothetical protein